MSHERFTDAESRAAWNGGAEAWDHFVESGADYYRVEVHGPALLEACAPLRGLDVLDLGCGQGYFSRELARHGARVTAVDIADALVARAREYEEEQPLGVAYAVVSAAEVGRHWAPGSFDLVASCMAVQDMAEVAEVLRGARDVLRDGGRMVFSVPHPRTDMPYREWERDEEGRKLALKLDRYFEGGAATCSWNMPRLRYHWDSPYGRYTLTQWSDFIAGAGFVVRRLREPHPSAEQVRRRPELEDCSRLPYFLIFDLWKPGWLDSDPAAGGHAGPR